MTFLQKGKPCQHTKCGEGKKISSNFKKKKKLFKTLVTLDPLPHIHLRSIQKENILLYSTAIYLFFFFKHVAIASHLEAEAGMLNSYVGSQFLICVPRVDSQWGKEDDGQIKQSQSSEWKIMSLGEPKYNVSYDFSLQEVLLKNTLPAQ